MMLKPLELKELRQMASDFELMNAYLVPFEHEKRVKDDGSPAIWYRVVFDIAVGNNVQHIVLSTSRKTLRRFANTESALEFVESELHESNFEKISLLRHVDNKFNQPLDALERN